MTYFDFMSQLMKQNINKTKKPQDHDPFPTPPYAHTTATIILGEHHSETCYHHSLDCFHIAKSPI